MQHHSFHQNSTSKHSVQASLSETQLHAQHQLNQYSSSSSSSTIANNHSSYLDNPTDLTFNHAFRQLIESIKKHKTLNSDIMVQLYLLFDGEIANALHIIDAELITRLKIDGIHKEVYKDSHGDIGIVSKYDDHHGVHRDQEGSNSRDYDHIPFQSQCCTSIYEIHSRNRRFPSSHYVIGLTTCTCEMFRFEVVRGKKNMCKHLLAAWIVEATNDCIERCMNRMELVTILRKLLLEKFT